MRVVLVLSRLRELVVGVEDFLQRFLSSASEEFVVSEDEPDGGVSVLVHFQLGVVAGEEVGTHDVLRKFLAEDGFLFA